MYSAAQKMKTDKVIINNKRTECEPSLLVAAEGRCGSQCRQYAMQHSEHVGQHDGMPRDEALSAQRNR